jgi:hypothetical protein
MYEKEDTTKVEVRRRYNNERCRLRETGRKRSEIMVKRLD